MKIVLLGVGGYGNNALNYIVENGEIDADIWEINTRKGAPNTCKAKQLLIGESINGGFGAGENPELGRKSAEKSIAKIEEILNGADIACIICGLGGGTGTGAGPVVAKVAKDMGCLTIGFVTMPFDFEAQKRQQNADAGFKAMQDNTDALWKLDNQKIVQVTGGEKMSMKDAMTLYSRVILDAMKAIGDIASRNSGADDGETINEIMSYLQKDPISEL